MAPPATPSSVQHDATSGPLYYAIAAVAVAVILLVLYNAIAVRCFSRYGDLARAGHRRSWQAHGEAMEHGQMAWVPVLIPASKYLKEEAAQSTIGECSVCLSLFEDGEEIRQMPKCRHSFHASCIDPWLYSHSNCPLCRANVLMMSSYNQTITAVENSRESHRQPESGRVYGMTFGLV